MYDGKNEIFEGTESCEELALAPIMVISHRTWYAVSTIFLAVPEFVDSKDMTTLLLQGALLDCEEQFCLRQTSANRFEAP